MNLSGRGDKDVDTAARWFGLVTGEEVAEAELAKDVAEGEGRGLVSARHPLADVFAAARAEGRAALIGYLPAGFPRLPARQAALEAMVDARRATSSRSACPTPIR